VKKVPKSHEVVTLEPLVEGAHDSSTGQEVIDVESHGYPDNEPPFNKCDAAFSVTA
jgi:hypothetical protein